MQVGNLIRPSLSRRFSRDPSLILYLPLYELDGAVFQSKDAYGHVATVTGATWGTQGRTFDGIDDVINLGKPAVLDGGLTEFSVVTWCYNFAAEGNAGIIGDIADTGTANQCWHWRDAVGVGGTFLFYVSDGTNLKDANGPIVTPLNQWNMIGATFKAGAFINTYVNTSMLATATTLGALITTRVHNLCIGQFSGAYNNAVFSEAWLYNRQITTAEFNQKYLATKWKYGV